jgi:FMN-dependent NADH-azoreductase
LDEEITHGVKVNEAGIVVDKMPASVEKMMVKNLVKEYAPKRVEAKIPTLSFYAWKIPKLSNAYTDEQKAAFDQFEQNVAKPFFSSLISEFQSRFPHANIVVIPDGHHYCFIAQEELVHGEMRKFLLE